MSLANVLAFDPAPAPQDRRPPEPQPAPEAQPDLAQYLRAPKRFGLLILAVFFGAFCSWGALAPLAGGAMAPGEVSLDGRVKTIQHLEGGILRQLLVREGDRVAAGQPLAVLDEVASEAAFTAARERFAALHVAIARAEAESTEAPSLRFPAALDRQDPFAQATFAEAEALYALRRHSLEAQRRLIRQRVELLEQRLHGLHALVEGVDVQLGYVRQEIEAKEELLAKGFARRPDVFALRRVEAELTARRGEYQAQQSYVQVQQQEAQLERAALDSETMALAGDRLSELRFRLSEAQERLQVSGDAAQRRVIAAPVDGVVENLRVASVGGVLGPGQPLADLVPTADELMVRAKVSPRDVDVVRVGLPVRIRFSAYSEKALPPIPGVVRTVSADRRTDEWGRQPDHYLVEVSIDKTALAARGPQAEILPGMPAEVMIVSAERTLFEYLSEPFLRAFQRSFREV